VPSTCSTCASTGGNRLYLNGYGNIDYPAPALMDSAYTNIVNTRMAAGWASSLITRAEYTLSPLMGQAADGPVLLWTSTSTATSGIAL